MNVLILANSGMGLYKFRKELLETLITEKYKVIVSFPEDEYKQKIESLGCQFVNTEIDRRGINPIKDLKLLLKYYSILNHVKPNIILSYTIKPNIYGGIMSRILGYRYLPNITGTGTAIEGGGLLSKLSILMYKISLVNSDTVFFQNTNNLKFFVQKGIVRQKKTILLPGSGVNIADYSYLPYPVDDSKIKVLYIGRILKSKGINELLEAIKIITSKYINVSFDIVGFCDEDYEEILQKYQNDGLLTFHGQQNDVIPYIRKSHAVVLPTYHEGMSNVLLESAASGRPVLASKIPGCEETFDEGVSGIGFEAKSTKSLVRSLEQFIHLRYEDKLEMGINGRKKIEREFNRKIIIDAYSKKIKNILEESNND